ncbi:MAG: hypothetical protein KDA43_11815 [Hyphomonas sp.]|nr:hypothetical protein [Hyphomonas sp.]
MSEKSMKRLLMVAYHFPPLAGSSGIQRTLRFARYLPEYGWQPVVLTANPRAYPQVSGDQLSDIPEGIEVIRAPAWDTSRHFAIAGRYPGFLSRPDRWLSWWPGGLWFGMRAVRKLKPVAIWSSYPIATAHLIGASLARHSGLPWIADFRDPMAQPGYPADAATWRSFDRIEKAAVSQARFSTFTTPSAARIYRERYPQYAERISLLENGYDEETFADLVPGEPLNPGQLTMLHSGIVYPSERDPTRMFEALALLKKARPDLYTRIRVRFRAPVHDVLLNQLGDHFGVGEVIEILPAIGYRDALKEMLCADGLLILQAANCNAQIPAKLYEYLRAGRPMLVLADPGGDTAQAARAAGLSAIAPLDDAQAIAALFRRFVAEPQVGTLAQSDAVVAASRRERSRQLATLFGQATGAT